MEVFSGLENISKVVSKHACIAEASFFCDSPLIGYFRNYALWVKALGSWVVSLHEMCEIRDEFG